MNTETDRLTDDARQEASPGAPRSVALCIGAVMMFGSAALIFPRLGHYALWDDEANTALFAQAVWRTGDTTAVLDHNIIAYAGGIELKGLKNRTHPPLDTYVAAPFVGALGNTAFAARLPFALTGLATVMLLAWWLWRDRADTLLWVLTALGVLGNVSFMLYCRSARWYSLTMFLSVLVAYLYLHRNGRTRGVVAIAVTMMLLFAANYMSCLALAACLLVDYLIRGRKVRRLSGRQWLVVLLPQVVICGAIFYVWNPLVTASAYFHPAGPHPWWDMPCNALFFLGYYLRDMNVCEYGVGTLIALCPLVYFARRNPWLLYGPLALAVYVVVMAILSPGHRIANICEVRYAVALIPLCIFLSVLSLWSVGQILAKVLRRAAAAWLVLPVAALAFGTNALHGIPPLRGDLRTTWGLYVRELVSPPRDAFRAAIDWLRVNVEPGRTVWVMPRADVEPLMYGVPELVYAWQLDPPPAEQFASLPPIHFRGVLPPDYIVFFGPYELAHRHELLRWRMDGIEYENAATIDVFHEVLRVRPELLWHRFEDVTEYDRETEAVYVLRRTRPAIGAVMAPEKWPIPPPE